MKKGEDTQIATGTKWMEKKRKKVIEQIATWFSEAGIRRPSTVRQRVKDMFLD
jgi:hypothetical protein